MQQCGVLPAPEGGGETQTVNAALPRGSTDSAQGPDGHDEPAQLGQPAASCRLLPVTAGAGAHDSLMMRR